MDFKSLLLTILVFFLLAIGVSSKELVFEQEYCAVEGCTMRGDINMNGNSIFNATWVNATYSNYTEAFFDTIIADDVIVNDNLSVGDEINMDNIFIGNNITKIPDQHSIMIGWNLDTYDAAYDQGAIILGNTITSSKKTVTIGNDITMDNNWGVGIGHHLNNFWQDQINVYTVALGTWLNVTNSYSLAIGGLSDTHGHQALSLGYHNDITGKHSIGIGSNIDTLDDYSIAIGEDADTDGEYPMALGHDAKALSNFSMAIGYQAEAKANGSIAIGSSVVNTVPNSVKIGQQSVLIYENGNISASGNMTAMNFYQGGNRVNDSIELNSYCKLEDIEPFIQNNSNANLIGLSVYNITSPYANKSSIQFHKDGSVQIILDPVDAKADVVEYSFDKKVITHPDGVRDFQIGGQLYADDKGTRIEDVADLSDCQFCDHIELIQADDGTHLANIIKYNWTAIELELSYDEKNLQEYSDEIVNELGVNKMVTKVKIIEELRDLKTYELTEKITEYSVEIDEKGVEYVTLPFGPDKEIHFGETSTEFKLQTADTQTLDDSKISKTAGDTNYGAEGDYAAGTFSGLKLYILIQFNMSSVDDQCDTILGANVSLYNYDVGDQPDYYLWEINTTVQPWNEGTVTWNNYPCGEVAATWDNDKCNSVYDSATTLVSGTWLNMTAISGVQNALDRGQNNMSFAITGGSASNGNSFRSKEYATAGYRPILWVTCTKDAGAPAASVRTEKEFSFVISNQTNTLLEVNNVGNITIPALTDCDTIDTDSKGVLMCGSDDGGASGDFSNFQYDNISTWLGVPNASIIRNDNTTWWLSYWDDIQDSLFTMANLTDYFGDASINDTVLRKDNFSDISHYINQTLNVTEYEPKTTSGTTKMGFNADGDFFIKVT